MWFQNALTNDNYVIARARKRALQSSGSNRRTAVLVSLSFTFLPGLTPARKPPSSRPQTGPVPH